MSNPFLNYDDIITLESLTNGTANLNINSAKMQNLNINLPLVTDSNKELQSSLILESQVFNLVDDLNSKMNNPATENLDMNNFEIINCSNLLSNPLNDTFDATGDIIANYNTTPISLITTNTIANTSQSTANNALSIANTKVSKSGDTMTGTLNMNTNNITNIGTITTSNLNLGSSSGYLNSTTGTVSTIASIPSTAISGVTFPSSGIIVGTTDSQTLTNKTMSGSSNTFSNIPSSAINNTTFLPLSGGTMTGTLDMSSNAITSTGTISGSSINSSGSVNANGINIGATSGTISGSGGVTIQPIGGQSINLSALGAGVINLNTAGTVINSDTSFNLNNNSILNVSNISSGLSGTVSLTGNVTATGTITGNNIVSNNDISSSTGSITGLLSVGNLRLNNIANRISSTSNLILTPATNSNLSFASSGTGTIFYTVDTISSHEFTGDVNMNNSLTVLRALTVISNGEIITLDTFSSSASLTLQPTGGPINANGIITAPQYAVSFDHTASSNAYTSGIARFVTTSATTVNNNNGFTIGTNGSITPTWSGSRRCRVSAMLGNGTSSTNDVNMQLWLQVSGTATNPSVGDKISYGTIRNTPSTRFGQTYSYILFLTGGTTYQFAGSINATVTISQTLSVSIESLLS